MRTVLVVGGYGRARPTPGRQGWGGNFPSSGHTVQLLGQRDAATEVAGDIVVLAVPYPAVAAVIAQRGDSLAGKIVVDITNP